MLLLLSLVSNLIISVTLKKLIFILALKNMSETDVVYDLIVNLKNIAAAHCIMTLAVTGIIGLQVTHFYLNKRADNAELAEAEAAKKPETKKTK